MSIFENVRGNVFRSQGKSFVRFPVVCSIEINGFKGAGTPIVNVGICLQERGLKKNKMDSILLGITRESVMRLDVETKDIIKVWPLTNLRRWAAAPNR